MCRDEVVFVEGDELLELFWVTAEYVSMSAAEIRTTNIIYRDVVSCVNNMKF